MSVALNINGNSHTAPETNETGWGTALTALLSALAALKTTVLQWGCSTTTASTTAYLRPGYVEAAPDTNEVQIPIPFAGKLTAIYAKCQTAPANAVTLTVRKNGVDQSLSATIAAGATVGIGAGSIVVAAGDLVSVKCATGGSTQPARLAVALLVSP